MTGGDKMTARFMRRDFFDFMPKFKLFVVGNHKPRLDSVDEAMRRRMLLVPFTVKIPPEERDHAAYREAQGRVARDLALVPRWLAGMAADRAGTAAHRHQRHRCLLR